MRATSWISIVTGALALGSLAACTAPVAPPASTQATVSQSPRAQVLPTPSPTPTPTPVRTSPLTGRPATTPGPVLVVKLDNTRNAQPHAGLNQADVVYLEEVEYGITRIAAVFNHAIPSRIGPVRSARITDIDLFAQYGSPGFAYSGAQHKMLPVIADSALVDLSPNANAASYQRDRSRYAPYNLFVDGQAAIATAGDASSDPDFSWAFSDTAPTGGRPTTKTSMAWSGASAAFVFDPTAGDYRIRLNGRPAQAEEDEDGQRAATVVIQYVHQEPSAFFDKGGGNTPHADTIGHGRAVVLRDGQAWDVTWDRPDALSGTTFTLADGTVFPFKPGQQWIVLLNEQTPATFTGPASSSGTPSASPSGA